MEEGRDYLIFSKKSVLLTFLVNLLHILLDVYTGRTCSKGKKEIKEASEDEPLGRHILAEFYGCPSEILNDIQRIERTMVDAALEAGAEVQWLSINLARRCQWSSSNLGITPGNSYLARIGLCCS